MVGDGCDLGVWELTTCLLDATSTCEVVDDSDLIEDGCEAVGEIDVCSWSTAIGRSCDSTGKPVLIFHSNPDAETCGEYGIDAGSETQPVVTGTGSMLIEIGRGVEGGAASQTIDVWIVAAIRPVVPYSIADGPLPSRGVLEDINGVKVDGSTPVGSEVEGAE